MVAARILPPRSGPNTTGRWRRGKLAAANTRRERIRREESTTMNANHDTAARRQRLNDAFEELRSTMIRSFRTICRDGLRVTPPGYSEAERREAAVQEINEFLDFRPLESFPAERLEFLALVIAYWREIEVEGPQEIPGPDPYH
jgi:hypothetical protein